MHFIPFRLLSLAFAVVLVLAGCSAGGGAQTESPSGWSTAEGRWWAAGVDTAAAFHNMQSLQAMGVASERTYTVSLEGANPDQFARAVQQELLPLYRNHPHIVDSLFEAYARSDIEEATLSGDLMELVTQYKNESYEAIRQHFQEPRSQTNLGQDVPVSYPDSLRNEETSGSVEMQLYLDENGVPQAVELLNGVHPVLNDIGMNAATRMRWEPAYVLRGGEWQPIPAWVHFNVTFRPPPEG